MQQTRRSRPSVSSSVRTDLVNFNHDNSANLHSLIIDFRMEKCCKSAKSGNSLDDSLTNIQWLYHLESPENLLSPKTMNCKVMKDKGAEESNEKETEPSPKNPHFKPPYSYATLILLAINSSQKKKMTLQEIYKWIEENFPYYKKCKKAWKNSIRHNLSLHSFFIKEQRPTGHPGKGNYWCLSPEGKENVVKEVMKHSQPVLQIPYPMQPSHLGSASGLRPILPKPSAGSAVPVTAGGIMGNIGILANGVQYSVPVVFVPGTSTDVTTRSLGTEGKLGPIPECGEAIAALTTKDAVESPYEKSEVKSDVKSPVVSADSHKIELLPEYSGKVKRAETLQSVALNSEGNTKSQCRTVEFITESKCVEDFLCGDRRQNLTELNTNGYCAVKRRSSCGAQEQCPMSPKKTKPSDIKNIASPRLQPHRSVRVRRSPLRTCAQPTLAAINSQASDSAGTANEFRQFLDDLGVMTSSPVKPITTPLKEWNNIRGSLNTPNWLSPLGTNSIGFSSKTGLTPLRYDSDSGFFTPVKDSEFDFNFLLSPNRLAFDPSPKTKTKEGCRKSLHLGTIKEDESGHESLLDWLQI